MQGGICVNCHFTVSERNSASILFILPPIPLESPTVVEPEDITTVGVHDILHDLNE